MASGSSDSPSRTPRITRRGFIVGAGAVAATGFGLYCSTAARHQIDVRQIEIPIRNLPDPFVGFRIAQISDIHLDQFTEPGFVERAVAQVNTLQPDLVALTGDFVSRGPLPVRYGRDEAPRCAEILRALTCPMRYGILGNHDTAVSSDVVIDSLRSVGIPLLVDSHVPIERDGKRLWLCGVNDPGTEEPRPELAIPKDPDGPVILMAHEPDYVDHLRRNPSSRFVDLMLSGHTHGGQICLPGGHPLILPPMGKKYVEGHFRFDHLQLYVNRGLGTVGLPMRFNCPPEITFITLKPDTTRS